jgi:hypothetical protein
MQLAQHGFVVRHEEPSMFATSHTPAPPDRPPHEPVEPPDTRRDPNDLPDPRPIDSPRPPTPRKIM